MKVSLILCPQWDATLPALPLALLAALLRTHGHEVGLFDMNKELSLRDQAAPNPIARQSPTLDTAWTDRDLAEDHIIPAYRDYLESFVSRVLAGGVRVVGFSTNFSNSVMSLHVAALLKKREPEVLVVFGGSACSKFPDCLSHLKTGAVDAVFFGEADHSLPSFVDRLEASGQARAEPGVLLRQDPSTWKDEMGPSPDLDRLPFADFQGFHLPDYQGKTIHSCRGCIRNCVYCDWGKRKQYRHMTGQRVLAEVAHQLRRDPGVTHFFFCDSLINGSMAELASFCDAVVAHGLKLSWDGYAIVREEMSPGFLARMKEAGCRLLIYGIESGSGRVLKDMRKFSPPELNARVLRDTAAAGIGVVAALMVGFPTETERDFEETLEFVRSNAGAARILAPSLFTINEMLGMWDRYQLVPTDNVLYWRTRDGRNTFPARVARLRRLFAAAAASGVRVDFEGRVSAASMEPYFERFLERYRHWEQFQAGGGT